MTRFIEASDYLLEKSQKILNFIYSDAYNSMQINDIMAFMQVPNEDKELFIKLIKDLEKDGKLFITSKKKVMSLKNSNIVYGVYSSAEKKFGFVIPDESVEQRSFGGDIFVKTKDSKGAMDKDKVFCLVKGSRQKGKSAEGEIIKIVKSGNSFVVGTFQKSKNFSFVLPDGKKMKNDIFIAKKDTLNAKDGQKVVVKIKKAPMDNKNPEGVVVEVLGWMDEAGVDILSIIKQYDLPLDFPKDVLNEIKHIPDYVLSDEVKNRRDLRGFQTVTIDGDDAKDLDDAISIFKLENGNFQLGVHIADVSHYVNQGTYLDTEALNRATSIYLVDRVIPMLPKKLSNGICSLNAGVDRLTLSCLMEIDKSGLVISHEICEAVINVNKRMTYDVVADLLTNKNSEFLDEYKDFIDMFKNMEELRNILFNKRLKRGAIEFDLKEIKVILDENNKAVDIKPYNSNIATSIIEEFMLVANETVAEHYFWLEVPFIYRSHEEPDPEKIENLSYFINKFGYFLKGNSIHSKTLQDVVLKCKETPEEMIINRVILRSMKQAKYTPENDGHFGLAAKYYCHFTSPIRRYPDLQIHRIIKEELSGNLSDNRKSLLTLKMPNVAKKCSSQERFAEEVERETIQAKKVEFMMDKVGGVFDAVISGVAKKGIFVELPNGVEGHIPLKNLTGDFYFFDESNLQYVGEKTGKILSLGDSCKVVLLRVDVYLRVIEFGFCNEND